MKEPARERDVRAALRGAAWEALLPRLIAYARRRLRRVGWYDGRYEEPSALSVEELVQSAIARCLDGTRTWNEDDPPELEAFLCGVMKSLCWSAKKAALRHPEEAIDGDAAAPAERPSPEQELVSAEDERRVLAAIEAVTVDDGALRDLYRAVLDGHTKRDAIAVALGWTPDQVSVARRKLNRRLADAYEMLFERPPSEGAKRP